MSKYRTIHNADCEYANEVVGSETPTSVVWAALRGTRPAHPERSAVCTCGANPTLMAEKEGYTDPSDGFHYLPSEVPGLIDRLYEALRVETERSELLRVELQQTIAKQRERL